MQKCENCGKEFATDAALAQHLKDKHGAEAGISSGGALETPAVQKSSKAKPKTLRKRNKHPVALGLGAVAVAIGLGLYLLVAPSFAAPPIPCLGTTGENYVHVHPFVQIKVEGTNVVIPAGVGYLSSGCTEEIHTHDASGVIHIEVGTGDALHNYTLADFFRVWNATFPNVIINGTSHRVTFGNNDLFGFKTDATHQVVVLVDNRTVTNAAGIPLEHLDYCNATIGANAPCQTAAGDPYWYGSITSYPYGTGHKILIEYVST